MISAVVQDDGGMGAFVRSMPMIETDGAMTGLLA